MTQPKTIPPPTTEIPTVAGWYSICVEGGGHCPFILWCAPPYPVFSVRPQLLYADIGHEKVPLSQIVERCRATGGTVYFQGPIPIWDGVKPYDKS